MCKVQMLRALVNQRLSAAVEEILVAVETTVAEYEEELCRSKEEIERQRKLLDAILKPSVDVRIQQADNPCEQQQHEPEQHYVKKEVEEDDDEEHSNFPEQQREAALARVKEEKKDEEAPHVREQLELLAEFPGQTDGSGKRKARSAHLDGREEPASVWEDAADVPGAVELLDDSSSSTFGEADKRKSSSCFAWTMADKETMAAFFEEYPMFYDTFLDDFKDVNSKRAVVKKFVKEKFQDKGRRVPTYKQVMGFLKNYRTRFVKLNSRRSEQADEQLTATEHWILNSFAYLRPHIKKRRGRATYQFPSSKTSPKRRSHPQPPSNASDSEADDAVPTTSTVADHKGAEGGGVAGRQNSRDAAAAVRVSADELLSQILTGADHQRAGHAPSLSSHEEEVKSFARYLTTLMMKIPEGPIWNDYRQQVLALTVGRGGRS
ncbi:uncharacterized protein LOC144036966 isoform X2 [Vanacampus margaritifer]